MGVPCDDLLEVVQPGCQALSIARHSAPLHVQIAAVSLGRWGTGGK